MSERHPKEIVARGYDRVSYAYRPTDCNDGDTDYRKWLSELSGRLRPGDRILDLGCGCGRPAARILSADFAVTGVDISPVQVDRAREEVPDATFICSDMLKVDCSPASFEAILCLFAIIHVPLSEQRRLIHKMRSWLIAGGLLLITVGYRDWTGTEEDWLGVKGGLMYRSHADIETYFAWFRDGFDLLSHSFIPEGDAGHPLLLLQKSQA